jgi:hypothetical protein
MTDDDRLPFLFAAQEIERRLGLSPGAAEAKLRELCASGVVKSWKEPYSMVGREPQGEGPPERIEPSEWKSRELDLVTDADGCSYWVDVSKIDLDQQVRKDQESSLRDAEITKQLKKGRRPGKNIEWKVFCESIRKACNVGANERGFSDETIERVTKRLGQLG